MLLLQRTKKFSSYSVESSMRKDVFERLDALRKSKEYDTLTAEQKRYLDHTCRDYERKGLNLSEDLRKKIETNLKRISELGIEFQKNLGEENKTLEFTAEELEGMPDDFLDSLERSDSNPEKLKVTLKYPHFFPISKQCKRVETRRICEKHFNSRCKDANTAILEELVQLRAENANILGFDSHADYILAIRMAKDSATVRNFLDDLNAKLEPLCQTDLKKLLQYKKKECEDTGEEYDGVINMWDFRYYVDKMEAAEYNIDQEEIKEYFPIDVVTTNLLQIYQDLLGLTYEEVPLNEDGTAWHEDVSLFSVRDKVSKQLLGYFYLDMHPREGKYGHAACFTLQQGCSDPLDPSKRILPVAACVCNFPKPKEGQPKSSLLPHNQVVTFFHEFGHVMHVLCSKANISRFSGTRVERDFVEAPSQMLENWCWQVESLQRMSGHYLDKSKPIPVDLASRLAKTKDANTGILNKRQLVFGKFDQAIHTIKPNEKADTAAIVEELQTTIMGVPATKDTNFAASFGHMIGYDSQYYGYMWSEVFSVDMFASMFKSLDGKLNKLFDPSVGMKYRTEILEPGGTKDAIDLLTNFLGRLPNNKNFLQSKGLSET
mmetsp:Transcript_941/g.1220  ORF Transcript_941/g.1220 Transcript_941/m.1220 type:complete len:603 (+) Transcript_941:377-2185(+)